MHQQRIPRAQPSVANCSLGAAVRELRARYGLSQEAFGELSGLHRNYIGAIERGEVNPTFLTLLRISSSIEIRLSGSGARRDGRPAVLTLIVLYERHETETVAGKRIGRGHE